MFSQNSKRLHEVTFIPMAHTSRIPSTIHQRPTGYHHRHLQPQKVPLDQPLSVNVNIEYKMDKNKFQGLDQSQPALLIHPVYIQRVLLPATFYWGVQLFSTPLPMRPTALPLPRSTDHRSKSGTDV